MRSMLVTHNIGHSMLEGFENRFAPIVLEDRAQVGLGTVVYAGCRLGREAIVASNSYVVSDIPAGQLAIGVPAKAVGVSARPVPRARQPQLVRRMLDDFRELLELRGVDVAAGSDHSRRGAHGREDVARAVRREGRREVRAAGDRRRGRRAHARGRRRPADRVARCSISSRGASTARAASCSTRCASSAASAASASSPALGGTAAA